MKNIIIICLTILTLNSSGQEKLKTIDPKVRHSGSINIAKNKAIKVIFTEKNNPNESPAIFLNGKYKKGLLLQSINPNMIDSLTIKKESIEIDNKKYNGQIFIQTKKSYDPKLISLVELKKQYLRIDDKPAIISINDEIITGRYNDCLIDENYILQIHIIRIDNPKENININLIKILTKTEENIREAERIMLR
ncbi:MAG: hypothetical protein V2I31_08585 [Mariniphaga sp.]|jgi:hypothetical protein|nr:hypothetical protein [Mariniphaga sp.]